jgi:hypothetical protein
MVQGKRITPSVKIGTRVRAKRRIDWVPSLTYGTVQNVYDAVGVYTVRFDGHPAMCDVLDSDIEVVHDKSVVAGA